jgi:hypothetical protein
MEGHEGMIGLDLWMDGYGLSCDKITNLDIVA